MNIFPAIDIIEGKCVRLTKGIEENKTIYQNSPVDMAKFIKMQDLIPFMLLI